jgi:hypothetical protein
MAPDSKNRKQLAQTLDIRGVMANNACPCQPRHSHERSASLTYISEAANSRYL